ncbi:MAG: hypothetical protein ACRYFW_17435 [Janthinobacterium lividum]
MRRPLKRLIGPAMMSKVDKRSETYKMEGVVVLFLLPMLIYCLAQTYRDLRRRHWIFASWGSGTVIFIGWLIEGMTRGPSY